MSIPDKIKKLIETFDYNLETYKKGSYNETQVRLEFINPFFKELGWDITNKQGYAEDEKYLGAAPELSHRFTHGPKQ